MWSEISAVGDKFKNQAKLVPMVQVGKPGQVGVAQFVDILFTVADILPGMNKFVSDTRLAVMELTLR